MSELNLPQERERLAQMIEEFMRERTPGSERLVLAIAAKDVRRGRRLTDSERVINLCDSLAEDDPALAKHIRDRIGGR